MSSTAQTIPRPRKYSEYPSWIMPFPDTTKLSYSQQSIEVEPRRKDNESGIFRNAWSEFYDLKNPMVRKNLSEIFHSGYHFPNSVIHSSFSSGYKKSNYFIAGPLVLHPADEDSGRKPCVGYRPTLSINPTTYAPHYVWLSYEDVDTRRRDVGAALTWYFKQQGDMKEARDIEPIEEAKDHLGLVMDTVGIWGVNSAEWQIVDLACQAYGKVVTALYDSSSNDTTTFILNHAESPILFLTIQHLPSILPLVPKLKYLRTLVLMHSKEELNIYDAQGQAVRLAKAWGARLGVEIWNFEDFESIGRKYPLEPMNLPSEAVYSLCYTSGTTGQPKAVILTHGQASLTSSCGTWGLLDNQAGITLSCLPLVHCYQRLTNLSTLNRGGAIALTVPDPQHLLDDMRLSKFTFLCTVPRMLNKMYQGIMARVSGGGIRSMLFHHALRIKMDEVRSTGNIHHSFWDRLIFNKIKDLFGGNISTVISGSAAASPDVLDFIQVVLGCWVYSGYVDLVFSFCPNNSRSPPCFVVSHNFRYGLTETFASAARVVPKDPSGSSTVGPVTPFIEAKMIDVPELGYFVRPQGPTITEYSGDKDSFRPRGEFLVRPAAGARCLGYYKDPVSTNYTFDDDGWIHTGDIAEFDDCGRFKIIDRKKNILKLSQGEFVAVERIESMYIASPAVAQLFVYGEMGKDYLVAVAVPAEGLDVAGGNGLNSEADLILKMKILEALEAQANLVDLKGYERIRNVHISCEMFSVDEGTLTPTFKIKRREAYEKYKDIIDELYKMPLPVISSSSSKVSSKL